jgi:hypothetical protein
VLDAKVGVAFASLALGAVLAIGGAAVIIGSRSRPVDSAGRSTWSSRAVFAVGVAVAVVLGAVEVVVAGT